MDIGERQGQGSWKMTEDDVFQKTWGFLMRKAGTGFEVTMDTSRIPAHLQTLRCENFASATRKVCIKCPVGLLGFH